MEMHVVETEPELPAVVNHVIHCEFCDAPTPHDVMKMPDTWALQCKACGHARVEHL